MGPMGLRELGYPGYPQIMETSAVSELKQTYFGATSLNSKKAHETEEAVPRLNLKLQAGDLTFCLGNGVY